MNAPFDQQEAPFGEAFGPFVTGVFAPVLEEWQLDQLPVEGQIPADLNGVYLRNGPNPRFAPKGMYHPFDGDGMLYSAHFDRGHLVVRNKWVRTEAWHREDATQEACYWGIHQTLKGRLDRPMKDSANTDVIGHAGAAIATWYLAGVPYRIDPVTLETLGPQPDYLPSDSAGMSAHPKVDEETGELMYFNYSDQWPYMWYGVVNADRQLTHHVPIELPANRLPHDMAITQHYSILHDHPVFHDPEAHAAGRHKIVFDSNQATRLGVIPRHGAADSIRWFEFSPAFIYHVVNAWEEGDEVVMVACRYMPARHEDGRYDDARTAKMIGHLMMDARLWRYRMNLRTGACEEQCLDAEHNIEFPGFNTAFTGRHSQWAYLVDHDPNTLRFTGVCKYNTDTGERVAEWSDGHEDCWYSEPWFAPADQPNGEDHGYVITLLWNDRSKEQQLQVFDAQALGQGPIARVFLPHRIPPGFHACWMKPSQIA